MAQVPSHSEDQVMHGLFPRKVTDAVLDALIEHEKLSMPLLCASEASIIIVPTLGINTKKFKIHQIVGRLLDERT